MMVIIKNNQGFNKELVYRSDQIPASAHVQCRIKPCDAGQQAAKCCARIFTGILQPLVTLHTDACATSSQLHSNMCHE